MKTKKIIFLTGAFLFFLSSPTYASFILPSVIYNDTVISCTNNIAQMGGLGFNSDTGVMVSDFNLWCPNGNDTWNNLSNVSLDNMVGVNRVVFSLGNDPPACWSGMTYTQCKNHYTFISEIVVRFVNTETPLPVGISIFDGFVPSLGVAFTSQEMITQLTASVGDSMQGFGPLLAVVIGIFLTMIITGKILGLFNEIKTTENGNKKIDLGDISQTKQKFYNWNDKKK